MTLLAWIVVLVLHSLLSLVVMMCNCHLLQCLVHGSSQGLARGCYFQLRGSRPELTRGNFARPPEPGSPRRRPGSHFLPLLAPRTRTWPPRHELVFMLDAPLRGESILLLLGRELPIRTLKTFIFGEKGGVHSAVLFRSAFEAKAWKKYQFLCYMPCSFPTPFTLRFEFCIL